MTADLAFLGAQKQADTYKEVQFKYIDDYLKPRDTWQMLLSTLMGVYGLIKQHELLDRQMKVAESMLALQQEYLGLSKANYFDIVVPTWTRQKDLYDRYVSQFAPYETAYMEDSFRLKEYTPQYALQEGRALAGVQNKFDKAFLQRRRQMGKYNSGRCCSEGTKFAILTALAKIDAANHGYRWEEAKKLQLDEWYWKRRTDGARIVDSMASRVVSGINGGTANAISGMNSMGNAYQGMQAAGNSVMGALSNQASFWGSVANFGFKNAGYFAGRDSVSPFGQVGMGGGSGFNQLGTPGGGNSQFMSSSLGGGVSDPGALPGPAPAFSFGNFAGAPQGGYGASDGGYGGGMNGWGDTGSASVY